MYYDALIIGSGIAGSSCALFLAEKSQRVLLVTKGESFEETNTDQAQGGIVFRGENDSWKILKEDIIKASDYSSWENSVRVVAKIGPSLVKRLFIQKLRVPFEQSDDGGWNLFQEAAHSRRRILHVKDCTGKAIQKALHEGILKEHLIEVKKNTWAVGLILSSQYQINPQSRYAVPECLGAYFLDPRKGEIIPVFARATVLATGGLNSLYRYSTGGTWNTGDGFAMAHRAGVVLQNMEYVQFHPTLLYTPEYAQTFLISESVRGEGAELINHEGKAFMYKYHHLGSLAPRDVVARAIFQEMLNDNTRCVYLDLYRAMSPEKIKATFPTIYEECLRRGVDIIHEPIPVAPGAHFSCGGVLTDTYGRTNIKRLYAVGEVACSGLHGANRLASTSLLEGVTFAYRAAHDIVKNLAPKEHPRVIPFEYSSGIPPSDPIIESMRDIIQDTMWRFAGLIRNQSGLKYALEVLIGLKKQVIQMKNNYGLSGPLLELESSVDTGVLVVEAALKNPISRGTHFRSDSSMT